MVEVRDLHKDYKVGKVLFPALRGIDLQIEDGEFTAMVGPSGSGKTTLLNIIGCLDSPTKGEVFFDRINTNQFSSKEKARLRQEKIGFIFQTFNLIPVLTAYENVELPLLLLNLSSPERKRRILAMLEEVGLSDFINRRPNEMSGGQQQRIAIARALVKKPNIVLADEPTANLDSNTARDILALMKELNQRHKTTFLFSTHDRLVMEYATRVINLRDGKVVGDTNTNRISNKT
ncbi:MAG: ABC transporter ATP-binding protein [candidate division WOR-3 bacterium]